MKNEWVIVYSTSDVFQAEVIKQMLLSNRIDAISMNQKDLKKAKEIISK